MNENKNSGLVTGLVLGAALGAGVAFLFGTPKGKEVREKVRDNYPEFFDRIDEVLGSVKENLGDKYDEVVEEVEKIKEEIIPEKSLPRRFVRSGRKL